MTTPVYPPSSYSTSGDEDEDDHYPTATNTGTIPAPPLNPDLLHNGVLSLSKISLTAFILGIVGGISFVATGFLLYLWPFGWQLPAFVCTLVVFHFLEFYVTARWNTARVKAESYIIFSNGSPYLLAHGLATLEFILESAFLPRLKTPTPITLLGLLLIILGQYFRTSGMITAGTNFSHIVATRKVRGHQLVTAGIYKYLRHPSYTGFFWWGVGTQLLLGNPLLMCGYVVVIWRFFNKRIKREEELLEEFFEGYKEYRERTWVLIPFIH